MTKNILAASILVAFASAALAEDDGFQVYGILDAGLAYQQHGLPVNGSFAPSLNDYNALSKSNPNVKSQTALVNGPLSDPRVGVKGQKSFGDGFHANFDVEAGFNLTSGQLNNHAKAEADNSGTNGTAATYANASADSSLNGQIFNRQAWAGIGLDGVGDLRLGRNTSFTYDELTTMDPMLLSQLLSPLGFSGAAGGGMGVSNNMRQDGSLKFIGKVLNINYGVMYETGNGTGVATQGHGFGIKADTTIGPVKVAATYQTAIDALKTSNSTVAGDINVTAYDTAGYLLALQYAPPVNGLNLKAGYERYTQNRASGALAAGSDVPSSLYTYNIGTFTAYSGAAQTTNLFYAGGDYALSSKLTLSGGYYAIDPKSYGTKQGVNNHWTSLLLDYSFDKSRDAYVGLSYETWSGTTAGSASPNNGDYSSDDVLVAGFRFKF